MKVFLVLALTIVMKSLNGSHEDGTAVLTQQKDGVHIVVSLKNAPIDTPQPAHIHGPTCNGNLVQGLKSIVNGHGDTIVPGMTLAQLTNSKSDYAINVHESTSNMGKYVSCGEIRPSTRQIGRDQHSHR
jgi:hypothetical protein